jgi:small multidrug resistance family-3 protein
MAKALLIYTGAALAEIAGCFAFWVWLERQVGSLGLAGHRQSGRVCLATDLIDSDYAGRAYAAYGGIYVAASIAWLWFLEGARPDRWDIVGAAVVLVGAAIILFGPRST